MNVYQAYLGYSMEMSLYRLLEEKKRLEEVNKRLKKENIRWPMKYLYIISSSQHNLHKANLFSIQSQILFLKKGREGMPIKLTSNLSAFLMSAKKAMAHKLLFSNILSSNMRNISGKMRK